MRLLFMSRDNTYVKDILAMIGEIESFTKNLSYEDFIQSRVVYRAVERNFEIIGEAVKRLSPELTLRHPDISWQDIAGFRDILIHEYAAVNAATVWDTLQDDIPKLKVVLEKEMN